MQELSSSNHYHVLQSGCQILDRNRSKLTLKKPTDVEYAYMHYKQKK